MRKLKNYKKIAVISLASFFVLLGNAALAIGIPHITWDAVTQNSDGTPITDLEGYRVYYNQSSKPSTCPSGYATGSVEVGNDTDIYTDEAAWSSDPLTLGGTYYFAVTAYDTSGNESGCATLASGASDSKKVSYPGDLNNDCDVNIQDVGILARYYAAAYNVQADANHDGVTNIQDVRVMQLDYNKVDCDQ